MLPVIKTEHQEVYCGSFCNVKAKPFFPDSYQDWKRMLKSLEILLPGTVSRYEEKYFKLPF